jgi:hypothetical protein
MNYVETHICVSSLNDDVCTTRLRIVERSRSTGAVPVVQTGDTNMCLYIVRLDLGKKIYDLIRVSCADIRCAQYGDLAFRAGKTRYVLSSYC